MTPKGIRLFWVMGPQTWHLARPGDWPEPPDQRAANLRAHGTWPMQTDLVRPAEDRAARSLGTFYFQNKPGRPLRLRLRNMSMYIHTPEMEKNSIAAPSNAETPLPTGPK